MTVQTKKKVLVVGAGVPIVLMSAQIAAQEVLRDQVP